MGRIKELINIFLKPNEIEEEFSELALASGLSPEEIKELNNTMNGINWSKFAREDEEKKTKTRTSKQEINQLKSNINQEKNKEISIDNEQER